MSNLEDIYSYMNSYDSGGRDKSQKKLSIDQSEIIVIKRLLHLAYLNGWRFVDQDDQLSEANEVLATLDKKLSKAISTFVAAGWMKPHIASKFVRKDQFLKKTFSEYEKNKNV